MHFEVVHDFRASRAAVAAVLCDPAFHTGLDLPDLGRPEVVADSTDGTARLLRLRYEYIGELDPIVRKTSATARSRGSRNSASTASPTRARSTFEAEADAGRLNGAASVTLEAFGDAWVATISAGGASRATSTFGCRFWEAAPRSASFLASFAVSTWKPQRCRAP